MKNYIITALFAILLLGNQPNVFAQDVPDNARYNELMGGLSDLRTAYDVQFYDLDVALDIENKSIEGSNNIHFTATKDVSKIQIDLIPALEITSIKQGATELNYTRELNAVFVDLKGTVKEGDRDSILVAYKGVPREAPMPPWDSGFTWTQDTNGKPWVAVTSEGEGASLWFPNKDHLSDEPDEGVQVSITVPDSLKAVSNGRMIARDEVGGDKFKYTWRTFYPINNYNITLYVGDYVHYTEYYKGPPNQNPAILNKPRPALDVDYYVLRDDLETAKEHFAFVDNMLMVMEQLFGPYPFPKDGFGVVQAPYLGMEHQGAIAYGNKFKNGYDGVLIKPWLEFDYLMVHETAHEWWGNNISTDDYGSLWIHESFATYADAIYAFSVYGFEGYKQFMDHFKKQVRNQKPILSERGVHAIDWDGDIYYKGALMLNTISQLVESNADWFKAMQSAQKKFAAPNTVSHEEFTQFLSDELRMDLSKVFEQYLETTDIPILKIKVVTEGKKKFAVYRWENCVEGFDMPVKLKTERFKDKWIYPTTEWKKAVLPKSVDKEEFGVDTRDFYIVLQVDKSEL